MDQLKPSVGSTFVCTRSGSAVSKRPASRVLTLKRPAASPGPVLKRPATSTERPEPSTPKTPEPSLPKTADLVEKNIAPDHEHGEEEPKEEDPEIECDAKKGSKPEVTKKNLLLCFQPQRSLQNLPLKEERSFRPSTNRMDGSWFRSRRQKAASIGNGLHRMDSTTLAESKPKQTVFRIHSWGSWTT